METTTETAPPPALVNGTALVAAQPSNPLAMPVSPRFVVERYKAIQEIVREVFQEDVHFGKIPGTGDKKTLLKAGFDALCNAFQFCADFVKQPDSVETDTFIHLVYKCTLTSATGRTVATGVGSCNSKEEKYRWTTMARVCPVCKKETIINGKAEYGGGYVCFQKKGGCNAKFKVGDPAIEGQEVGRKENDNAWNYHNTLTKMAQKRAGMAAIITACGISGDFTQDVEDFDQPHDKAARSEPGIDVQANNAPPPTWQERAEADDRAWAMGEEPPREHDFRNEAEDATFTPAVPADIQAAMNTVFVELETCTTKQDFQMLKARLEQRGGPHLDARIKSEVNLAYAKRFPAKPKTTA